MVEQAGGIATWITCDVTDRIAVERAVDEAVRITGRLDAVVHNAFARPKLDDPLAASVAGLTLELWNYDASVAMRGAYYCAKAGFSHLVASKGKLILLSSTSGVEGTPTQPAYSACKGALRAMTKSLAREWGRHGVTVNAVCPYITTPAFSDWWDRNPELKAEGEQLTALGYIGDPVTHGGPPFVFLLSEGSSYLTGQTLFVDAGRYMSY
jgi:3-oxoacyl-[acyl-carrier protein] reductase